MKRVRKIVLWVFGVVVGLVVVGWLGLQWYLGSSHAKRTAGEQLSQIVGLQIEIEELDVGASSTSATLRIPDPEAGPADDLVRVGSVSTDLTLGGLLSGRVMPTRIAAENVDVLIRLDEDGKLLSPMPKPKDTGGSGPTQLPRVTLSGGRVRIRQTGKPEFDLQGVSATLQPDSDAYKLSGEVHDPNWGDWKLDGRFGTETSAGRLDLTSEHAPLSEPLLRSIPYVPEEVWDNITASGRTVARVSFTFQPGTDLGYEVELQPKSAQLAVKPAEVTVSDVTGVITIGDGAVKVGDGKVNLADGQVSIDGRYQFDQPTGRLTAELRATGVDVSRLPASWQMPDVTGRLKGKAALEVLIHPDGRVDPRGSGSGEIIGAKFGGFDAEVKLKLTGGQGGYRFQSVDQGQD